MTEHGAHHDLACVCDQDCPNYVDIEEKTD